MRVCLLHYSAPPIVGGVESVLAHHARLMSVAGHNVRLVVGRGEREVQSVELTLLPLIDSRHPHVLEIKAELDAGRVPPDFTPLVEEIMASLRPVLAEAQVIIAHNVCSLHKNLALTAALHRLHHEPGFPRLILWHHDLAWTTPHYQNELHAGYPWDLLRTDWVGGKHVTISALRRRELAELLSLAPETISVVPNGIEVAHLLKLESETQVFYQQLKLAEADPLVLLPVRLTPRKNIELALHILAALRKNFPRAVLVVTGPPGPHNPANATYFAQLKKLRAELGLADAVYFMAEINDHDLPDEVIADFFRLADALLLPSREEGFGLPLIEAAINRLPVFCSDISPLRDLGSNEVDYFSPDADPKLVAMAMVERLQTNSAHCFAVRVRRNYTWEFIYRERIEPLLQQIASA